MKKIIIFILLFLPLQVFSANINLDIEIKDIENNPLKDFVIIQSTIGDSNYLVTDEFGKISSSFEYEENETDSLSFLINGNRIILRENDWRGTLLITYNTEEQTITDASYNGRFVIANQELTKNTNYYLLIIYGFLTLCLWTIIVLSRIFYMKAHIDIEKHNQKKIYM